MIRRALVVGATLALFVVAGGEVEASAISSLSSPVPPPLAISVNSWFDHHSPGQTSSSYLPFQRFDNYQDDTTNALCTGPLTCYCTAGINCYNGHTGTDFNTNDGTNAGYGYPVVSAAPGTVQEDGFSSAFGYYVRVWHSSGNYSTLYGHMRSDTPVQTGSYVARGAVVGYSDCTGICFGAHLHFGVYDAQTGGNHMDPYGWSGPGSGPWPHNIGYLWTSNPPSYALAGAVVNMLRNASGEQATISPWSTTGSASTFLWNSPAPLSGTKFVRTGGGASAGSVYQDVVATTQNDSYFVFSLWARVQSACVPVTLKVWGLNGPGPNEFFQTSLNTLCTSWKYVTVPGDFAYAHSILRVEVYVPANVTIDIDATELVPTKNLNASFEHAGKLNGPYWNRVHPTNGQTNWTVPTSPGPIKSGSRFLHAQRTGNQGTSKVYQDIAVVPAPGESYTFSVWLRAMSPTLFGRIRIHTLGPTYEFSETYFTLDSTVWRQWSATLEPQSGGHTGLRIEIYFDTTSTTKYYDMDATQIVQNLLSKSSFESGAGPGPWFGLEPAGTTDYVVLQPVLPQPLARDGVKHLRANTDVDNGSVYQDIPITPIINRSYSFVIWVRCVAPCPPSGVDGLVKLVALPSETNITPFYDVGTTWTPVVATLDASTGGSALRAQIHMSDEFFNYDIDATGNSIGIAPNY